MSVIPKMSRETQALSGYRLLLYQVDWSKACGNYDKKFRDQIYVEKHN